MTVLKMEKFGFTMQWFYNAITCICSKDAEALVNNVDFDQTAPAV